MAEIGDSTLVFDLTIKARLYARAGVIEYWVLDVAGRRLIVHRKPVAGKYTTVTIYAGDEPVAPLAAPAAEFRVSAHFGCCLLYTSRPTTYAITPYRPTAVRMSASNPNAAVSAASSRSV